MKFEEEFQNAFGMMEPSFFIFLYWSDNMKHQELLKRIIPELRADQSITAVMLMGSVAAETENPYSDLNLFILGSKNKLQTEQMDGITVEYLYITQEAAQSKLDKSPSAVYYYFGSKIIYDLDGRLIKLMRSAMNKYKKYKANEKDKLELRQYLMSARSKINAAIYLKDFLRADYITATTTDKLIEAVFALNDIPLPPVSKMFHELPNLRHIPDPVWFENLYNNNTKRRTESIISAIDWALDLI